MYRASKIAGNVFRFIILLIVTPVVFSWLYVGHFFPRLLKVWNPMPIKVTKIDRTSQEINNQDCAYAYDLIAPAVDLGWIASDYESYLLQTVKPYQFVVNRPELLAKPKPSTLRRIANDFKEYGLVVKEIHVTSRSAHSAQTVIHRLA